MNMQLNRIATILLTTIALSSCKKEVAQSPQKQDYIQYFKGTINGQAVDIKTSTDLANYPQCTNCDIESIAGDWTGFPGVNKEAYKVSVVLANNNDGEPKMQRLIFRIFGIKKGEFTFTGDEDIYGATSSFAFVLKKSSLNDDGAFYTADPQKAPFKIQINRYEFEDGHGLPFVGGTLNGTLYNTTNRQDSITVKDASFEVRF